MTGTKRIDTSVLENSIAELSQDEASYNVAREDLVTSVNELNDAWKSPTAAPSFEHAISVASTRLIDIQENLKTLKDNLEAINQSYTEWDESQKSSS